MGAAQNSAESSSKRVFLTCLDVVVFEDVDQFVAKAQIEYGDVCVIHVVDGHVFFFAISWDNAAPR